MRNDSSGNDPRTIWQNQPTETTTMTLKLVRWKGRELHAKTRKHLLGTLAGPLAAVFFYALAIRLFSPLQQLLHPLFALALVWSLAGLYFLNRGMWSAVMPGDAGLSSGLEFCRREIERRCHLLRRVLLWSFGPVLLTIGAFILVLVIQAGDRIFPNAIPFMALVLIWIAAYFVIRMREQRELQREIAELDDIERENRG